MRYIFFLLLISFSAQAQELVVDSTNIINKNGKFFSQHILIYDNLEDASTTKIIGDTVEVSRIYEANFRRESERLANDIALVSRYSATVTDLIRTNKMLKSMTGVSPIDSITQSNAVQFSQPWSLSFVDKSTSVRFRITAAGAFQWKADTAAVWRPAIYIGSVIRLQGLNGLNEDLWKVGQRYVSIDRRYLLAPTKKAR